jgi:hypothetical protein
MAGEQSKQPVKVTRDELYKKVWETPMSRLAAHYGISGNGLAKTCDRLKIPYPSRGYWARKAAGQTMVKIRLPDPEEGTPIDTKNSPDSNLTRTAQVSPEVFQPALY